MRVMPTPIHRASSLPNICAKATCYRTAIPGRVLCRRHYKATAEQDAKRIELLKKKGQHFVYFVQIPPGPIKVGKTNSVEQRLSDLNVSSPYNIIVLAVVSVQLKSDMDKLEKMIHRTFEKDRIKGEWFNPSKGLLSMVEAAKEKNIDKMLSMIDLDVVVHPD